MLQIDEANEHIIKAVAKHIWKSRGCYTPWHTIGTESQEYYLNAAKKILEVAANETTDSMGDS